MPDRPPVSAEDLSGHVDGMPEWAGSQVPRPLFADRLRAHFERDPEALPIVSGEFEPYEHPNLQLAIDADRADIDRPWTWADQQAGAIARQLQPSLLVLEDVDVVAEERTQAMACPPLLFELLNEMDGLADDADVIFLLTTNRPDLLEPALASRPGRIDQAVQIPLPDAACRRRLFELYSRGLTINADLTPFVERTAGAGGASIRELLRKAALFAADEDRDPLTVTDRHLEEALHELVVEGGKLPKSPLGAIPPRALRVGATCAGHR